MPANQTTHPPEYVTIPDVARRYGVSDRTIRRWVAEGRIPAYRMGPRVIRLKADDVENLFEPVPTTDPAA